MNYSDHKRLRLTGHNSTLRNNFESLTLHIVLEDTGYGDSIEWDFNTLPLNSWSSALYWAQLLIRASTRPYTLVVRIELLEWTKKLSKEARHIVEYLNRRLYVEGRKEGDISLDRLVQDWVWENSGKILRWDGI